MCSKNWTSHATVGAQLTNRNFSVESELGDNIPRNVGLDKGLFGLTLGSFQQPVELLRIKLLHIT